MPRAIRAAVAAPIAGLICFAAQIGACAAAASGSSVDRHIQRIEHGLLPPVLVKGEPEIAASLSQRMAELRVPGVSIAVVHEGRLEWARGFGVAEIGGAAVKPETLFQAASISKPITALAVLRLVEAGRLDLDTDVSRYLQSWQIPPSELTNRNKVTLRRLLTHTAGMTVHGFPGYASGAPIPSIAQILNGLPPANTRVIRVDVEPGTLQRYSGGGYVVVQQLLMDVTGKPFDRLMQDLVLGPIGMARSTFEQPLLPDRTKAAAAAYTQTGAPVEGGAHVYPEMAPAGLWTTPTDLARYIIAIQRALRDDGRGAQILSAPMAREMLTRQPVGPVAQGLGPQLGGTTRKYFLHGGSNAGFMSRLIAYTDSDGLVVMTNSDNGYPLIDDIVRAVAREYDWPDFQPPVRAIARVDPHVFQGYLGTYRLNPSQTLTVTLEGTQLYSQISDQEKHALFPLSQREFFMKEMDERIAFTTDANGRATALTQYHFGVEDVSPRER